MKYAILAFAGLLLTTAPSHAVDLAFDATGNATLSKTDLKWIFQCGKVLGAFGLLQAQKLEDGARLPPPECLELAARLGSLN